MPATDPLLLTGTYSPSQFAEAALYKRPSKNASKRISKIELLKDTRPTGHWLHEFLVFTVDHEEEELYLYFDRNVEDVESWEDMAVFALALFQGKALDILEFGEPGCKRDVETNYFTKAVFQINLKSSFTLKDLAKILDSVSYEEKYPKYGLFSANCWAWSRGFLLDIIFNFRIATPEILKTNGREMVLITVEEMKLYMLTEYGAYGRLLLHFSSDDVNAQSRTRAFPNPYGIRVILLFYYIFGPLVQLKNMAGPYNWTICLRTLLVYHDRTLENSTKGPDCTFLPLHPNFIPVIPGHIDDALPSSFCQPGKYLYLLTSPICSSSQPVSAVHVHVIGTISDVPDDDHEGVLDWDTSTWLSCGIIRRSEENGELTPSHVRLISNPRGISQGSSPVEYSTIHVFNSDEEFTREIKHGDMIALWAHSYRGQLHTPRSASIKVIESRRPLRMIDWILALLLLFETGRSIYLGGFYIRLAFSAIGCLLYWTNTYCEGWLWSNLSALIHTFPESLNLYGIRIILLFYSILGPLVQLKNMIIGPSNWSICFRTLLVYHDRTLENSTKGPDCTFLPLHPNLTDSIPVIPVQVDNALPSSFCQPGKYLYLLTSPVCSSSQPVSAVHVHVFGTISDVPGDDQGVLGWDTSTWLSCGIIRRSEDNGELIEVATSHVQLVSSPRGTIQGSSPAQYSTIHVFDSDEEFTREIEHGDMIALWAHSYRGQLHTPRSASVKVVVSPSVQVIDLILALLLLFETGRSIYLGGFYIRLAFSAIGCLLYWTSTYCEGWLWSNLSALATVIHAFPESLNLYGIRIILLLYSILGPLVQLKNMIIGPSNWTTCLRKLLVYHDRTLESSTTGSDCTFLPLRPNFTDFIPVISGHMDHALPSSFCQPGKYLYLLTSPVCSSSQPVSAVHVHVFGAMSDIPGDDHEGVLGWDTSTWLSCGIIRRSEDNGELVEVATSHVRLISSPLGTVQGSSPVQYSTIHVFDSNEEFTREIKHGDMIALWAHAYRGQLHTLRSASIKVVVSRRPFRMIDWIFASLLLFEIGRSIHLGGSYNRPAFSAIGCLLYWTNTYCEGWLWSNLSAIARILHASATPLSLPPDLTSKHNYSLPAFLQEPITSDIFSAPLHSIELFQEESGKEIVLATFSHQHVNYVIHFIGPSTVNAGWLHYISFLTNIYPLKRDEVRIFRVGGTERTVRESYVGRSILMIRFKAGENPGTEPTAFELELRSIVKRLKRVQGHYWWYFWLNSRYWTWQWWLLKAAYETAGVQEFIEVEGRPCSHEEAAILLSTKYKRYINSGGMHT